MSTADLSEDDEGKRLVTTDGEEVGMIAEVRGGTAYVEPDPGMFDSIKAKLDWGTPETTRTRSARTRSWR